VKAKIILSAVIILYGICGVIYAAILLVKSQGHTDSINNSIIYGIFCLFFFIIGVTFLYRLLSQVDPDDAECELIE
jgi:TRAP-type C4-dicarboxylate transport system permease small subunit